MASVPESLSLRVGLQADLMLARKTTSNTKSPKKFEPPKLADSCCVVGASSPHPSCSASSSIHGAVHTLAERTKSGILRKITKNHLLTPSPSGSTPTAAPPPPVPGELGAPPRVNCRKDGSMDLFLYPPSRKAPYRAQLPSFVHLFGFSLS